MPWNPDSDPRYEEHPLDETYVARAIEQRERQAALAAKQEQAGAPVAEVRNGVTDKIAVEDPQLGLKEDKQ